MVFCYKLLTESPRRSASVSPTRPAPDSYNKVSSLLSDILNARSVRTYEGRDILADEVLDSIPKRDWRLLAALVHKREEQNERDRLADEFKKMWSEEKGHRQQLETEMSGRYRRYVAQQREADRRWLEMRRNKRCRELQLQRAKLLDMIQYKEQKSADLLATLDDKKVTVMAERSLEEDVRAVLAAQRRARLGAACEWKKRSELEAAALRADEARHRREAKLHDSSRRALITNMLNSWECSMLRREMDTMDAIKRAGAAARLADAERRAEGVQRARRLGQSRARRAAQAAAILRAAVIGYRS